MHGMIPVMPKLETDQHSAEESDQRRDALLLKLLHTPPQPRPKRRKKLRVAAKKLTGRGR